MRAAATELGCLIDGARVQTGETSAVLSPYDGSPVGEVARGGRREAAAGVDAAARAMREPLPAWRRAEILRRVSALLAEEAEPLARTISAEAGKPIRAARIEAARAASTYGLAATEAEKLAGRVIPMDATPTGTGRLAFTTTVPVGVVGAITPFNFPLNLVAHKTATAFAAGCAVVLKPASQTPLSALRLGELSLRAGLPPGWLNVVPGRAAEIGEVLLEDERVRAITFTGSAEVGWELRARAPRKRVTLELGNSSPLIVTAAADLELAAEKVARHAFGYAGQTCVSVQRVLVQRRVHDAFLEALRPRVERLVVGDPASEETDVGPLIDRANHERVAAWVQEAVAAGARLVAGGGEREGLLEPTVLADVDPAARVCREEVFGPVCSVLAFDTLDEAIELANGTEYGLQAAVFTRDLDEALGAIPRLEFGSVMINEAPEFRSDQMPYGGVKASGNTKEGPAYAVREFVEERLVVIAMGHA
jgi:acyl-CoA reductase-like NAD-dependent aldehyde dehydrogenase